ncbi:MAG: PD-(D/E)XK nuclease family protein [Elusimicrobiota bacterium]
MSIKNLLAGLFGLFGGGGTEVSYSKVYAYLTCPMRFKLLYEDGKFVQPTGPISLGHSVHRALQDFHSNKYDGLQDLLECFDKFWVNEGFATPQQALDYYNKGCRMLENYWNAARDMKSEILFVEKNFSFHLGRHSVRGIIDRIDRHPDGTYEVIDYKTHNEIWNKDRIDSDLQLSVYALACKECLGFEPEMLTLYFLAHGQKLVSARSGEQLAAARKTIASVADKIVRKDYTPNLAKCKGCELRNSCPKYKKGGN